MRTTLISIYLPAILSLMPFPLIVPVVILQVLSKQPAKDITGFWFFVFDGAEIFDLQNKERFDMIYNKIDSLDKKQGLILKNEFKKMYSPPKVQYSYDRSFPGYLEGKGLDRLSH